ncbi:MAG: hypothetical protein R2735_13060 [Microthrixaceae bacterium]
MGMIAIDVNMSRLPALTGRAVAAPQCGLRRGRGQRDGVHQGRGQSGSVLMLVMAFMLVSIFIVTAIVALVMVSLSSSRAYRSRTDSVRGANDAIDLVVAQMRTNPTRGVDGSVETADYEGVHVVCNGDPGSGAISPNSIADRRVTCEASKNSRDLIRIRLRFVDQGGNSPGADVEVVDRLVYD